MAHTHYVKHTFLCLTDEEIGDMQHLLIDKEQSVARVAEQFGVSLATTYRVRSAVPKEFVKIQDHRWHLSRAPRAKNRSRQPSRKRTSKAA